MRNTFLLSAALAVALSAVPAMAELQSSPAERDQTRALNEAGAGGTYASPQTLNGEQGADAEQLAQNDQSVNYGTGPGSPKGGDPGVAYQSRSIGNDLQYGDKKKDAAIDRARRANATNLNPDDYVALKTVNADHLDGDDVKDMSGTVIGRVIDVTLAKDGTPAELSLELNDGNRVRVSEESLRFNPSDRTLLANVDVTEMRSTASAEDTEQSPSLPVRRKK